MSRRRTAFLPAALLLAAAGCAQTTPVATSRLLHWPTARDGAVVAASHHEPGIPPGGPNMAMAVEPEVGASPFSGPQPVEAFIHRALAENRTVRAAQFNVMAMESRIPQVTSLEDPIVSNSIFPIPSVAPQYSLMGYMPYDVMIAQQFPWCGTLRVRGQAAEQEVKIALMELAAAQLDTISAVKRAYYDLAFNQKAEALLLENRDLTEDFLLLARERARTATASQIDVLQAETARSDIDRELSAVRGALATARATLARELHVSPESDLAALLTEGAVQVPEQIERLYQLAAASRPDLRARLAAIARDQRAIELARKRYYPNVTLGFAYQIMERTNAESPMAGGMPNVGMFVGFNLPIYRKKLAAGVQEAQARAAADARLYEAERDQAHRDIKELFSQAKVLQEVLGILNTTNLPNAEQILKLTGSEFTAGNVDALALITAQRNLLQVRLEVAQVESDLAKSIAALERAVGTALSEHPPADLSATPLEIPEPVPPTQPGPFSRGVEADETAPRGVDEPEPLPDAPRPEANRP
ncbi:TolC family protein [Paludisphaera sp.]|uniref:TolC family protein n=1 Tax=Paludisphaera sp. TaxID=2017432 RepID=UPI00301E561A